MTARRFAAPFAALFAVFATYVLFLLWVQFGFLALLRARLGGAGEVRAALGIMGLSGLGASLIAGALLARVQPRALVRAGLAASALLALAAIPAGGALLLLLAGAIGAATALTTVALASGLGDLLPARRFGRSVGLATGLAYFACNLPPLFEATPAAQAVVVAALALAAAVALGGRAEPLAPAAVGFGRGAPVASSWTSARGLAGATLALALLVGLDSAAFAWIQANPGFKLLTWGGGLLKPMLGLVHLGAAVAAGLLLDRGRVGSLLATSWLLFASAFTLLGLTAGTPTPSPIAGPLYAVGISLYSVVLVVLPASGGAGGVAPRLRAAFLFGIAGWLGSALGVGMAQDLGRIPRGVLLVAGLLLGAGLLLARRPRSSTLPWQAPAVGFLLLALPAGLLGLVAAPPAPGPSALGALGDAAAVARGRHVYVEEGCIHCHSQYVRPAGAELAAWGPHRPLDRSATPVLIGNRRQGPDLTNVGLRRNPLWQRLHLEDPRSLVQGSRMPSYRHLFARQPRRGADLVAYLAALGRGAEVERAARVASTAMPSAPGSAAEGKRLFARHCASCHGEEGRGDGPLAPAVAHPALDLTKGALWFVPRGTPEGERAELCRLIRFGIPGTAMAGHELLADAELADLAAYVGELATP